MRISYRTLKILDEETKDLAAYNAMLAYRRLLSQVSAEYTIAIWRHEGTYQVGLITR